MDSIEGDAEGHGCRVSGFVIGTGEAVEDGFLPGAELLLKFGCFVGFRVDEILFLGGIGVEIEEFGLGFFIVDDEFEAVVNDGAWALEVLFIQ